jgi:hypothetical protein
MIYSEPPMTAEKGNLLLLSPKLMSADLWFNSYFPQKRRQ